VLILGGTYAGPAEEGERALAPVREMGAPVLDISARQPWVAFQSGFDPFFPEGLRYYWKSLYLDELGDQAIGTILEFASRRPSPRTVIPIRPRHGAVLRPNGDGGAFPTEPRPTCSASTPPGRIRPTTRRTSAGPGSSGAPWPPTPRTGCTSTSPWVRKGKTWVRASYGPHLDRLLQVKERYDPANLFGGVLGPLIERG
jgi:hypothetical protein